ncbi:hypothetical protein D6D29_08941 [Aureobasidium pullulans]|nr:hypothetical protein D6D29_08941 [Aureobasidium pullulans]
MLLRCPLNMEVHGPQPLACSPLFGSRFRTFVKLVSRHALVLYTSLCIASIHQIRIYLVDLLLLVACKIIHVFGLAAAAKFCGPGSLNLIPYPCHVCSCSLRVQDIGSGAIPFGRNAWRRSQLPEQPDTGPLGIRLCTRLCLFLCCVRPFTQEATGTNTLRRMNREFTAGSTGLPLSQQLFDGKPQPSLFWRAHQSKEIVPGPGLDDAASDSLVAECPEFSVARSGSIRTEGFFSELPGTRNRQHGGSEDVSYCGQGRGRSSRSMLNCRYPTEFLKVAAFGLDGSDGRCRLIVFLC